MKRLLLIEDHEIAALGIRMALEASGYVVQVLHDGSEALDVIAEWKPQVLILDVSLPGRDGVDVATDIRGTWPRLPIIFATGHEHVEKMSQLLREDQTMVLQKPFELRILVQAIERFD